AAPGFDDRRFHWAPAPSLAVLVGYVLLLAGGMPNMRPLDQIGSEETPRVCVCVCVCVRGRATCICRSHTRGSDWPVWAMLCLRCFPRNQHTQELIMRAVRKSIVRVYIHHEVADYSAWRKVYDAFAGTQRKLGVTRKAVYQSIENPNDVTVTHDFK